MPIKVRYAGTAGRYLELPVTGKQSVWFPGQADVRSDTEAALLLATGLFERYEESLTPAQVAATQALVSPDRNPGALTTPAQAARDFARASLRRALTAVGTYAGTGAALTVTVGWVPDLFIIKDVSAATDAVWSTRVAWVGRSLTFQNLAGQSNGAIIGTDGTVAIGTLAAINTNTNNYEWFAYKDNGSGNLLFCDHAGNPEASRVLRYFAGANLKAALFKRDNTNYPHIALRGQTSLLADGSAATSSVINADGTITVGQGADINIWSSNAGEGCQALGFVDGAESIYVTRYTGTGAAKTIQTPFAEVEAALIFPRGASGLVGALWTSRLAAATTLSVGSETAATVGAQAITAVAAGRIALGTSARVNSNGIEYVLIAFRKNRQGAIYESAPGLRPLRSTAHMNISASAYFDCGTSDTLKIDGPITLEWWGTHGSTATTAYPTSASNNDDTSLQTPLIWRANGADAVNGSVSYGLQVMNPGQTGGVVLWVAVTDVFNMPQNSSFDVDDNQPWNTGLRVVNRTLTHIIATHDGVGGWKIYMDGVLRKERERNMLSADPARPNIASGSGHSFIIGARKRNSTPTMTQFGKTFYGARVYARELTAAEALANYESLFSDNDIEATSDFREEWLASNATTSATLPATVNSANNGTASGTVALEGL